MNTKKGPYRKVVVVEMTKDYSALKKGSVIEMHPVLANRLIAEDCAKKSAKSLTAPSLIPEVKINESKV